MALPRIIIEVEADTVHAIGGIDAVQDRLRAMGQEAERASRQTDRLGGGMRTAGNRSVAMRMGIQNAAFQMQDFSVQVAAGTSASVALAQQLPQLLGSFGALGAVLGVVAAVGIPVASMLRNMSQQGRDLTVVLGTLQPAAERIAAAFSAMKAALLDFAVVVINNLDRIITIALTAATVFGVRLVAGFVAARVAAFSLSASLVALRAALIRTGIGALIVGAGELVFQFTRLSQAAGGFGEAMSLVGDVGVEVWERIKSGAEALGASLNSVWLGVKAGFLEMISAIQVAWADMLWAMGAGMSGLPGLSGLSSSLLDASNTALASALGSGGTTSRAEEMRAEASSEADRAATLFEGLDAPLESVQRIRDLLASMREEGLTLPDILGVGAATEEEGGGGALERLDEELTAQEQRIKSHFDRIRALTQGGLSDKLGAWGDYFNNLVSMTGSNNQRLLAMGQAFQAAQSVIDAWGAFTATLRDPAFVGRPWARLAAAGQVLAAGLGAVNAIRSVTSSGAGAGGAGAGGAAAAASGGAEMQAMARPTQNVVIDMINASPSQVMGVQQLVDMLTEANRQGYDLNAIVRAN